MHAAPSYRPSPSCRHAQVVSFEGWQRVDAEEVRRGAALGKPRDKLTDVPEMLQLAAAA